MKEIIRNVIENSKVVSPRHKLDIIREDPADNKVLECARHCRADFILSGNTHLLRLRKLDDTKIITPRKFML